MGNKDIAALERLAAAGIVKCLDRIARAYSGAWRLSGVSAFSATMSEAIGRHEFKGPAAAVRIKVDCGLPFAAVLLFNTADIGHISQCFLGELFSDARKIEQFEDVMLLEIGNIILNALINSLLNAIKQSAVPSVPALFRGDAGSILQGLGGTSGTAAGSRMIAAGISVELDGRACRGGILAMIPEELAARMESAA